MDIEETASNKRGGIPPEERDGKRLRPTEEIILPSQLLANVLEYVPFETVLECGAVSRSMLHETMPLLKSICIDESYQMNLAVASRFRDIKEIRINSLLSTIVQNEGMGDDEYTEILIDFESRIRVLPFLSKFDKLELVHFGGKDEDGDVIEDFSPTLLNIFEGDEMYPNEGERERLLGFIDMLSGAFRCGSLPKSLMISGLVCPDAYNHNGNRDHNNNCETCIRACKSFPLESVVEFECLGSSDSNAQSGRLFGLDVCLERAKIESIIEGRTGGKELLCSHKRLLRLLSSGRRYVAYSTDGEEDIHMALNIVKYKQGELDEIKRVIEYANLDVKKLSMSMVSTAIMGSFAVDNRSDSPIPQKNQRYISVSSLDYLVNEIGLPIDREDFERPLTDLMGNMQQFVSVLTNRFDEDYVEDDSDNEGDKEYEDIELDCLQLIRRFLEIESNPRMVDLDVIRLLSKYLRADNFDDTLVSEASSSILSMLRHGTDEQKQMVEDEVGITRFCELLGSSINGINKVMAHTLVELVLPPKGTDEDIKTMSDAGAIPSLIDLLDSRHDDCVEGVLRLLVAAKDHTKTTVYESLLPQIIKLIRSYKFFYWNYQANQSNDKIEYLRNCSALLRKVLEGRRRPIQSMIDSKAIPTLLDVLQLANDDAVKMNLSHVMISLLDGTKEQVEVLLKEAGVLDLLISLVTSSDVDISSKTILVAGKIADKADDYRHRLCQAGLVTSLLRVLGNTSSDVSIVKAAAETFSKCCRDNPMDAATAKASLRVLNKALVHENECVVTNSCEAVFHILSGWTGEELKEATNMGFVSGEKSSELNKEINEIVEQLLNLISHDDNQMVNAHAIKTIHLISSVGDIKAITLRNGMARITKLLFDYNNGNVRVLASKVISNIITDDNDQIQTAIENNTVPGLLYMLAKHYWSNRHDAIKVIHQMTKAGDNKQIKYLVSQDCIRHLCGLLTKSDSGVTSIALLALKDIFKVGRDEQSEDSSNIIAADDVVFVHACHGCDGCDKNPIIGDRYHSKIKPDFDFCADCMEKYEGNKADFELEILDRDRICWLSSKLDELMEENKIIEEETKTCQLLQSKKAWLEFHTQNEKSQSLAGAVEVMKDQQQQALTRSESFGDKVTRVGADTSLGKAYQLLRDKEDETRKCFDAQIVNIERELRGSQTKVERLLLNASKDSSQEKWSEQIVNGTGLLEGMRCVDIAMERTTLTLKSIREARASSDRKIDSASLSAGLRHRLFPSVIITRKMQVVFVPLDTSHENICFTISIDVRNNSQLEELRASIVDMARKHYGYENELKEEDVQLTEVFRQKVTFFNDMDGSISRISPRGPTYAFQTFPLDKVKEEFAAYKAKKDMEAYQLCSGLKLDSLTMADLNNGVRWQMALQKYLSQPMILYHLLSTIKARDEKQNEFYEQLLKFIDDCKKCSDAKSSSQMSDGGSGDGSKSTLAKVSRKSSQFKKVETREDLSIFHHCTMKFKAMMQELKKQGENEDGIVVHIQIRNSDSDTSAAQQWKTVGEPIVVRISSNLSVSGLREVLGRRLASCGAIKSKEMKIMNRVALTFEQFLRYGGRQLGTITLDQFAEAENPKPPFVANPNDPREMDLVVDVVKARSIIVVNWPKHLDSFLDEDALSAKHVAKDTSSAKNRTVTVDIEEEVDEFMEEEIDEFIPSVR